MAALLEPPLEREGNHFPIRHRNHGRELIPQPQPFQYLMDGIVFQLIGRQQISIAVKSRLRP
jgi:hypothetical protein